MVESSLLQKLQIQPGHGALKPFETLHAMWQGLQLHIIDEDVAYLADNAIVEPVGFFKVHKLHELAAPHLEARSREFCRNCEFDCGMGFNEPGPYKYAEGETADIPWSTIATSNYLSLGRPGGQEDLRGQI